MSGEVMLPLHIIPSAIELEKMDAVGMFQPQFGYAVSQRVDYGATRWRARITFEKLRDADRHTLLSFIARVGRVRPILVPIYGEAQRGSGSFPELMTDPTFISSSTNYSFGTNYSVTAHERTLRLTRTANTGIAVSGIRQTNALATNTYTPYVGRAVVHAGPGTVERFRIGHGASAFANGYDALDDLSPGFMARQVVPPSASVHFSVNQGITNMTPGDYFEIAYMSFSRCGLASIGQNHQPWSNDYTQGDWSKSGCSVSSTSVVLPNGASGIVNTLFEDNSNGSHFLADELQLANLGGTFEVDITISAAFKAAARSWVQFRLRNGDTAGNAFANFNVSSGTIGTVTEDSSDASWINERAFIKSLGNDWWQCGLTARSVASHTNTGVRVVLVEADHDTSYLGGSQDAIRLWNVTVSHSRVPIHLSQSSGTNYAGSATGTSLWTSGWAASQNALLNAGDFVNIVLPGGLHLARLTAPLNTDSIGMGLLQFEPPLPVTPAQNAPIIVNRPMLRCIVTAPPTVRTAPPGYQTDVTIEVEEVFG